MALAVGSVLAAACAAPGTAGGGVEIAPIAPVPTPIVATDAPPHPADVFGFEPGADYQLADYSQLLDYYRRLDASSDRVRMVEIGRTTRDQPMVLLFISSAENIGQLERWRSISERLARARVPEEEARRLAAEGKTIVWIDAGLHSTEVAHSQHAPLLAYHMATDESAETARIREDVVLLLMPLMNPDGHEVVVDWYRENRDTEYETTSPPVLYHEYVGHDINRDWYMKLQQETRVLAPIIYNEWHPQLLLNHHQTAPFPARIHIAPFDNPVNPLIPPLIVRATNLVGTYMAQRFEQEEKPGVLSMRQFPMWRADGMRYAPYYRNIVGVHTEVAHASATPRYHDPEGLPEYIGGQRGGLLSASRPSIFYPNPWRGGWARLAESVDYHLTASMGLLDIGSRLREDWLYDRYRLGRSAIQAGEAGDPFAFVLPPDQWDAGEAVRLINVLRRGGVEVHRATAPFVADGETYPPGSYVVYAGQAFGPYVRVLLENQIYPERRLVPDGPVDPPYDLTGWTLPEQLGVRAFRVETPFEASVEEIDRAAVEPGRVSGTGDFGYALPRRANASVRVANRLLAQGAPVYWAEGAFDAGGRSFEPGTWVIEAGSVTRADVEALAQELGLDFTAIAGRPATGLLPLELPRVGLYKPWVANIDEGWTRWLLEQYEFTVVTLHDEDIRAGDLSQVHAIVLPAEEASTLLDGHAPGTMPDRYVGGLGTDGIDALRRFVEGGGTLVALDEASDLVIEQFGLPVRNAVRGLTREEFTVPGSLVRLVVDTDHVLGRGMPGEAVGFMVERRGTQSRAFDVDGAAETEVVARYAERDVLVSGLEIGADRHIAGKPALVSVRRGEGEVVLIGFRPQLRGQPGGTFKLLFNPLYTATLSR
jgi:hypothetical protein